MCVCACLCVRFIWGSHERQIPRNYCRLKETTETSQLSATLTRSYIAENYPKVQNWDSDKIGYVL